MAKDKPDTTPKQEPRWLRQAQTDATDEWMPALFQFFDISRHRKSNPRPLADLMRSGKPIPKGVLHFLADFIDPPLSWEGYPGVRLVLEMSKQREKMMGLRDTRQTEIATAMHLLRIKGVSHEIAAEMVAQQFGKSSRWVEEVYAKYRDSNWLPESLITPSRGASSAPKVPNNAAGQRLRAGKISKLKHRVKSEK